MLNNLQAEIDSARQDIHTDSYSMSVGELSNLYRDGDLEIYPEFQRYFRWSPKQKSRFIESLLLGIPIPSLFVHQRQDGIWDVVDGVQRLSTILEFQGILRDHQGAPKPPITLQETDYLPSLEGLYWSEDFGSPALTPEQQRLIKRASIDVKIVKRESDERAKFDLFQRLNTGGSTLSDQETRNSLLVMTNPNYMEWLTKLSESPAFQECTSLSDKNLSERYEMELSLRFLLLKDLSELELRSIGDISDFLTERSVTRAASYPREAGQDAADFNEVFTYLHKSTKDDSFRRYSIAKSKFEGGFSVSSFEAVTLGLHANLGDYREMSESDRSSLITERIQQLWSEPGFKDNSGQGIRANTRIARTVPYARTFFKP